MVLMCRSGWRVCHPPFEHCEIKDRTLQKPKSAAPAKDKSSPEWGKGQPRAQNFSDLVHSCETYEIRKAEAAFYILEATSGAFADTGARRVRG